MHISSYKIYLTRLRKTCIFLYFINPTELHTFVSAKSLYNPKKKEKRQRQKKIDLADYLWLYLAASLITNLPSVPSTVVRTKLDHFLQGLKQTEPSVRPPPPPPLTSCCTHASVKSR